MNGMMMVMSIVMVKGQQPYLRSPCEAWALSDQVQLTSDHQSADRLDMRLFGGYLWLPCLQEMPLVIFLSSFFIPFPPLSMTQRIPPPSSSTSHHSSLCFHLHWWPKGDKVCSHLSKTISINTSSTTTCYVVMVSIDHPREKELCKWKAKIN